MKLFSIPLREYILTLSAKNSINEEEVLKKINEYISSVRSQLILDPPSNVIDEEEDSQDTCKK